MTMRLQSERKVRTSDGGALSFRVYVCFVSWFITLRHGDAYMTLNPQHGVKVCKYSKYIYAIKVFQAQHSLY